MLFERGELQKDGSLDRTKDNVFSATSPITPGDYAMMKTEEGYECSVFYHEPFGIVSSGYTTRLYLSKGTPLTFSVRRTDRGPLEEGKEMVSIIPYSETLLYSHVDFRHGEEGHSPLEGRIITFLGDSYIANHHQALEYAWNHLLSEKNHMDWYAYGINGNGLVTDLGHGTSVRRRLSLVGDTDYLVLAGGKNDYNKQCPLSQFRSGIKEILTTLKEKHPKTKILVLPPWSIFEEGEDPLPLTLASYRRILEETAKEVGVAFFQTEGCGMAFEKADFRKLYAQGPEDRSHLNRDGHLLFLPKMEETLSSL